mgnify:CR=1 FL=1
MGRREGKAMTKLYADYGTEPRPGQPDMPGEIRQLRRALYMSAASCQGGNSGAGRVIAETFGVPFPIKMKDLLAKAKTEGFDPVELWPWWEHQRQTAGMPSLRIVGNQQTTEADK